MTRYQHSLMLKADEAIRLFGEALPSSCCADQWANGVPAGTPPRW